MSQIDKSGPHSRLEALRLFNEHDPARWAQLAAFNQKLGRRLASLDRGECVSEQEVRERLRAKSDQRKKSPNFD